MMKKGYEDKQTQKARLLKVLKEGKKVTQIDLPLYLELRKNRTNLFSRQPKSDYIDAIAELGIANLPARIYGLKADGYDIKTEDVKIKGRFGSTHFAVYSLNIDLDRFGVC